MASSRALERLFFCNFAVNLKWKGLMSDFKCHNKLKLDALGQIVKMVTRLGLVFIGTADNTTTMRCYGKFSGVSGYPP
jgi:hypothetical protein